MKHLNRILERDRLIGATLRLIAIIAAALGVYQFIIRLLAI